ncbi:MAG: hypothetical protein HZA15_09725 [Nitrospirae bacterium]|nr:hypothetical protein [Nitrospirota bacterium]
MSVLLKLLISLFITLAVSGCAGQGSPYGAVGPAPDDYRPSGAIGPAPVYHDGPAPGAVGPAPGQHYR